MRRGFGRVLLMTALVTFSYAQDVRKLVTITTPVRIQNVSVCGSSGLAAGFGKNASIYVWRLPSGEPVTNGHAEDGVSALACSPDGAWLAVGKRDGSVAITDISGKAARTLALSGLAIDNLAFSPDGSLLAVSRHEAPVQLWNPAKGTLVAALQTDFSGTVSMDFSPDNALFATADSDTAVRIYDRNGKLKAKYSELLEPFAISFMADSKQVVIGGADSTLTFLDAADAHAVRQFPKQPDPVFAVAALPDGLSVLSLHIDAAALQKFTTLLWDIRSGKPRELAIDGSHIVGYGITAGRKPLLFTADSDSSLTAWLLPN
jgi:WD40 repeat protein